MPRRARPAHDPPRATSAEERSGPGPSSAATNLSTLMRLIVTGGAGFVGSNVACTLALRHPDWSVTALDSLKRRGSELTLARLKDAGVAFVHGDVRQPGDLLDAGPFDALLECSAEPSVMAGIDGGRDYVVHTNLLGA